jgi:hypothetical protein
MMFVKERLPLIPLTSEEIKMNEAHLSQVPEPKGTESILQEAQRLTHGDRNKDYGHPLDDYTRTAALVSALLAHKLTSPLTPSEAAMIQCCVKLSRQVHKPKRDNMVDLAGYAWVAQECLDEEKRREQADKGLIDKAVSKLMP